MLQDYFYGKEIQSIFAVLYSKSAMNHLDFRTLLTYFLRFAA